MRDPRGSAKWAGAWSDYDIVTNKASFMSELGFVQKNDGDFFITPYDFYTNCPNFGYNHNPSTKFQATWMALGNTDDLGVLLYD